MKRFSILFPSGIYIYCNCFINPPLYHFKVDGIFLLNVFNFMEHQLEIRGSTLKLKKTKVHQDPWFDPGRRHNTFIYLLYSRSVFLFPIK